MQAIINKAKKDFLKNNSRATIKDIFSISGFIKYFLLRNFWPAIKDIVFYVIEALEIFLVYKFLGKDYAYIGILGLAFFVLINIISRAVSFSLREKMLVLINQHQKQLIPKYFSAVLVSIFIIFLVSMFAFISIADLANKAYSVFFINKIFSGFFVLLSSFYFQATYLVSRVFFNLVLLSVYRLLAIGFVVVSFKYLNVYSFIIYFYLDAFIQLFNTYYYCRKTLSVNSISLISKNVKDYFKNLFWFAKNKNFFIRTLSLFLSYGQKLVVIVVIYLFFKNYLFIFFILLQIFGFLLILAKRVSKSLYFDVYNQTYNKSSIILNRLILSNFVVVVLLSLLSVFIFSNLELISKVYPKWESIYTNLLIFNRWTGFYLLAFFSSLVLFFNKILEYSESHKFNIVLSFIFNYLLVYLVIINDQHFMQTKNPISYFSISGYLSVDYFACLVLVFYFQKWTKSSFIFNLKKQKIELVSLSEFIDFSKHSKAYLFFSFNKKFARFYFLELVVSLLEPFNIINIYKLSFNTYIFSLKEPGDLNIFRGKVLANISFLCEQVSVLDKKIDFSLLDKYFYTYIHPSIFEFKKYSLDSFNLNEYISRNNLKFKEFKNDKTTFDFIKSFSRNIVPERLIYKKNYLGIVPEFDDNYKFKKLIKVDFKDANDARKLYQKQLLGFYKWFFKSINEA